MFAMGNFENTISIYLLMCNREFTFSKCLMCSAVSLTSYPKDGIIDLTIKANFKPKNTEMKYPWFWTQKYGMLLDSIPKNTE